MTSHVLNGGPRDRQLPEGTPRWNDESKGQVDQEWQGEMANEDRARFPRLWVVVPLNEQVLDMRGMDRTVADDRVSEVRHSDLADVLPSDADSVTRKKSQEDVMDHMTGRKGACLKPDLNSKCEFGGVYEREQLKTDLHFPRT